MDLKFCESNMNEGLPLIDQWREITAAEFLCRSTVEMSNWER